jgi:ADP-heptose:LPS heptosyltransferase
MSMRNAIGFCGGQIGDAIVMTVAIRAFKQQYPHARFTFALAEKYKDVMPLFYQHELIDDYHVWDGWDATWPSVADRMYCYFRGFNHVYNALAPHSRPDWYNHHTYGEEACLRFGLPVPDDRSYHLNRWFPLWDGYKRTVTLSLFPSAGQVHKTMPVEECEQLCVALKGLGYQPVQLGGKYEYVKLKNALAPHLSILEATKLMLSSALHITADTAFSSIAAAYKHPVVGFYGINYPDMTDCFSHLPPNPNALYIKNRDPQSVKADEVIALARVMGELQPT